MLAPVPLTLVSGGDYQAREAAIHAALAVAAPVLSPVAVLLEGLPAGDMLLQPDTQLLVQRIAPGCFCCIGLLSMKVTLNRLLRQRPARIYLAVASSEHLDNIKQTLAQTPFNDLLLADSFICL
jgi:hypothetical protein